MVQNILNLETGKITVVRTISEISFWTIYDSVYLGKSVGLDLKS